MKVFTFCLLSAVLSVCSISTNTLYAQEQPIEKGVIRGPRGPRGHHGEHGEEGDRGHHGKEGKRGKVGHHGATGPQGTIGPTGPVGPGGSGSLSMGAAQMTGPFGSPGATGSIPQTFHFDAQTIHAEQFHLNINNGVPTTPSTNLIFNNATNTFIIPASGSGDYLASYGLTAGIDGLFVQAMFTTNVVRAYIKLEVTSGSGTKYFGSIPLQLTFNDTFDQGDQSHFGFFLSGFGQYVVHLEPGDQVGLTLYLSNSDIILPPPPPNPPSNILGLSIDPSLSVNATLTPNSEANPGATLSLIKIPTS